jgi:serine/threonine protein kinase
MPFEPSTYAGSSFELVFPDSLFANISKHATHFVQDLLQVDPNRRPTAARALSHPWLRLTAASPQLTSLPTSRRLQALVESGNMPGKFTHARDLWLYNCATTPVGPGSRGGAQQLPVYDLFEVTTPPCTSRPARLLVCLPRAMPSSRPPARPPALPRNRFALHMVLR